MAHAPQLPLLRSVRGFTAIELMVVIAIAAILSMLAVPSLQAMMRTNRLDTVSNQFIAMMYLARSEAIRAPDATVTFSNLVPANGLDWSSGWQEVSTLAPAPLQLSAAVPPPMTVKASVAAGAGLTFDSMGRLRGIAPGALAPPYFVFCADGAAPPANNSRAVLISPSGRVSQAHLNAAGVPMLSDGTLIAACTP